MVDAQLIEDQLKTISFKTQGWGRTEVCELRNIILSDEEIFECVNGLYEGGFALLVATDVRVLLIDKKPLSYLRVEDLRFDMINEIDYNHRLIGAYITISTGNRDLKFTSLNQHRLRRLIGHVQRCMAEVKKQQSTHAEGQSRHLERLNQQLQSYLLAQYQQQQKLYEHLQRVQSGEEPASEQPPEPVRPSPELADYLYAQSLLRQHPDVPAQPPQPPSPPAPEIPPPMATASQLTDLYAEGMHEVFGSGRSAAIPGPELSADPPSASPSPRHAAVHLGSALSAVHDSVEDPLRIALAKLPLALQHRKFGGGLPPLPLRPEQSTGLLEP